MAYRPSFFKSISGGARSSANVVLPALFDLVGRPSSMLDVGCGTGDWLATAGELGVGDIQGVDGHAPVDLLEIPTERFQQVDLTAPVDLGRRFDLVSSLEVAEHLPAWAAPTFVSTLASHGDLVLFSAAIPGQGLGNGHINEQPPSYWAALFAGHGYEAFDLLRPLVWDETRVEYYYRQNMMLFARGVRAEGLRSLPVPAAPLHLVHPGTLAIYSQSGIRFALKVAVGSLGRTARRRFTR